MNKLFQEISDAHPTITGWSTELKSHALAAAIVAVRPAISLEIGTWGGRGTFPMAMAQRYIGSGVVWAIDPWDAKASVEGQVNPADAEWWSHQDKHELVYQMFLKRGMELKLMPHIVVHRKRSDEVEPPECSCLVVDGNHGEQSIRDIQRYAPKVTPGGFLFADDLNWSGGSVVRAIGLLPEMGFREVYRVENTAENWACFQKVK